MRHDVIHEMHCRCESCAGAANAPVISPADLNALKMGVYVGMWATGIMLVGEYAPSIVHWLRP